MCGIAGFVGAPQPDVLSSAMSSIAYRGPDDHGRYEDASISIGHCRLAIIDVVSGHQPMQSDDGRYVLAFNGEIYNFRDLRRLLEGEGRAFRTSSDTEVLLQWLASRGRDGLADLNGMFALAFWDRRDRRLLLARDRLGIKPLYLFEQGDVFAFASEIKALQPIVGRMDAHLPAVYQFMTFQNVLTVDTFFKGVKKVPPAGWVEWSPAGVSRGRFWSVSFKYETGRSFNELVETYRATLDRAVERHLISDVPVGTYLSGGIDSASVATMAARRLEGRMHAFTGAFVDAEYYDERPGARAVADRVGATLHEIEIQPADFCDSFGRVIYHLDEPTLGTGALPQFIVSKLASEHVKVVLTGHGGDEAFAGYQVSKAVLLRELLRTRPLSAMRHLARIGSDELSRVLYFSLYPLVQPEVAYGLFIMTPRRRRAVRFTPAFLGEMNGYEPLDEVERLIAPYSSAAEALQALYLTTYLPTLFIQEDKVGMAHSLESRMPLCDNELIDLALSVGFEQKLHGGALKAIPKAAMRDALPDLLFRLPKRGFPTPFARWFRQGAVRDMLEDLLLSRRTRERGIFEPEGARRLMTRHLNAGTDTLMDYARANEMYSMAAVELWFRTYVDQPAPASVH